MLRDPKTPPLYHKTRRWAGQVYACGVSVDPVRRANPPGGRCPLTPDRYWSCGTPTVQGSMGIFYNSDWSGRNVSWMTRTWSRPPIWRPCGPANHTCSSQKERWWILLNEWKGFYWIVSKGKSGEVSNYLNVALIQRVFFLGGLDVTQIQIHHFYCLTFKHCLKRRRLVNIRLCQLRHYCILCH